MKVSDFGVKEIWNFKTVFFALLGIRTVKALNAYYSFEIAVVGVPPWRSLQPSDFFNKKCYELSQ